jgi:hypothetical protein
VKGFNLIVEIAAADKKVYNLKRKEIIVKELRLYALNK